MFQIVSSLKKIVIFYWELQGSEADTSEPLWRSGGQRTTSKTWISPFTMWLSRDRTQVIGFAGKCPYPLSHLTCPKICAFSYLILLLSLFLHSGFTNNTSWSRKEEKEIDGQEEEGKVSAERIEENQSQDWGWRQGSAVKSACWCLCLGPKSVVSTHVRQLTTTWSSNFKGSLFWSLQAPAHIHTLK